MRKRLLLLTAALAVLAGPALADGPGMDCRCLYKGKYFEQGDTVCIRVDGHSRLARCDMALNNTSWTFIKNGDGCPSASLAPAMTPIPKGVLPQQPGNG